MRKLLPHYSIRYQLFLALCCCNYHLSYIGDLDDPGVFGHSLNVEYQLILNNQLLTLEELKEANETAAQASFLPEDVKKRFWYDRSD